jgi:hypothetical protein
MPGRCCADPIWRIYALTGGMPPKLEAVNHSIRAHYGELRLDPEWDPCVATALRKIVASLAPKEAHK